MKAEIKRYTAQIYTTPVINTANVQITQNDYGHLDM